MTNNSEHLSDETLLRFHEDSGGIIHAGLYHPEDLESLHLDDPEDKAVLDAIIATLRACDEAPSPESPHCGICGHAFVNGETPSAFFALMPGRRDDESTRGLLTTGICEECDKEDADVIAMRIAESVKDLFPGIRILSGGKG